MLALVGVSRSGFALNAGLILLLVMLSGLFSGSETVLFSLTRVQLERAAASSSPLRRVAAQLMRRPKQTLMTVLVANTTVNVLLFATSYVFFRNLSGQMGAWVAPVSGLASVLLVVVGGEVVPKVLAVSLPERLLPVAATAVRGAGFVAGPVGRVIDWFLAEPFTRVVLGGARARRAGAASGVSIDELKALLELSWRGGTIEPLENTFLRSIIDLGQTRVRDVMVPRVEVTAYDVDEPSEGLRALMRQTRHKKVPVFEGSKDTIIGLVYAKVLFLDPDRPLRDLVLPVRFVPELISCEQLLAHFRESRTQVAIVVDEFGGMAGLVTLEDVLEEIVGELHDPEDGTETPDIRAIAENEYDISGRLSVQYWVEAFQLPPRAERSATVGGLVMAQLGRPARTGDVVRLGNIELRVTNMRRWRIDRLRLRVLEAAECAEGVAE